MLTVKKKLSVIYVTSESNTYQIGIVFEGYRQDSPYSYKLLGVIVENKYTGKRTPILADWLEERKLDSFLYELIISEVHACTVSLN